MVADALSRSVAVNAATRARSREEASSSHDNQQKATQAPKRGREEPMTGVHPVPTTLVSSNEQIAESSHVNECVNVGGTNERVVEWDLSNLVKEQDEDSRWSRAKAWIAGEAEATFPEEIRIPRECFFVEEGILYVRSPRSSEIRTVLPEIFVKMALQLVHSSPSAGHLGCDKSIRRAKSNFYWPNMAKEIRHYVEACQL